MLYRLPHKKFYALGCLSLFFLLAVFAGGCDGGPSPEPTPSPSPPSDLLVNPSQRKQSQVEAQEKAKQANPAQWLADEDGNSAKVEKYREVLSRLKITYVEDDEQIAKITLAAQKQLADKKIKQPLLPILETLTLIYPANIKERKYDEAAAAYLAIRFKEDHKTATNQLKAVFHTIYK